MRRRHGVASHSDDGDGSTLWLTLVCNYSQTSSVSVSTRPPIHLLFSTSHVVFHNPIYRLHS